MDAIILCAGKGERIYPLTLTRPKPLLPVAGKTILEHILSEIKKAGINRAILVVGDAKIERHLSKKEQGIALEYATQEKPLGTADAVKAAGNKVKGDALILNGDNIPRAEELKKLLAMHKNKGAALTLSVRKEKDVSQLASVVFDAEGRVSKIVEKPKTPPSTYASLGIYVFGPEAFEEVKKVKKSERGEYELPDAIQALIDKKQKVYACELSKWEHITYPWDLLVANEQLLKEQMPETLGKVEKGATLAERVHIGKNTLIRAGSYIETNVHIGDDCIIGPNCFIRANTFIANNVHIGQAVEIKNSIVMSSTNISHLSYVGDSIIGENCNIGAGTICANLRFDDGNVKMQIKDKQVDSGRRKLGAVIGDGCKTGIHSVINPGKRVFPNSYIGPGTIVNEDVPQDTFYYAKQSVISKKRNGTAE